MKIVWERKQPKQQRMALIAMDWYNFSMGFLLIIVFSAILSIVLGLMLIWETLSD